MQTGRPCRRPTCIRRQTAQLLRRRRLAVAPKGLARRLGEGKVVEQPRVGMTATPHVTAAGAPPRGRGLPGGGDKAALTGGRGMARLVGPPGVVVSSCCCCWALGVRVRGSRWWQVPRGQQHGRRGPLTGGGGARPAARPAADLCADGAEEGVLGGAGGRASAASRVGRGGREHLGGRGAGRVRGCGADGGQGLEALVVVGRHCWLAGWLAGRRRQTNRFLWGMVLVWYGG